MPSNVEPAEWAKYFGLLDHARQYAIWRHEEDGEELPNGRHRPPRFVAVVQDQAQLLHFQQQMAALDIKDRTRWPLQVFDETWGWARVQINQAQTSRRLIPGERVVLGKVLPADAELAQRVAATLQSAGHTASIEQRGKKVVLVLTPGDAPLTARTSTGRAFRLYAWAGDGTQLHTKLSVGAVVVRACGQVTDDSGRQRKRRADALQRLTEWDGVSLWTK